MMRQFVHRAKPRVGRNEPAVAVERRNALFHVLEGNLDQIGRATFTSRWDGLRPARRVTHHEVQPNRPAAVPPLRERTFARHAGGVMAGPSVRWAVGGCHPDRNENTGREVKNRLIRSEELPFAGENFAAGQHLRSASPE